MYFVKGKTFLYKIHPVAFEWVRIHHPFSSPNKKHHPNGWCFLFGGGRWIRTTEAISSRFTVCPLWPLGNSPNLLSCRACHTQQKYYSTDCGNVNTYFAKNVKIFRGGECGFNLHFLSLSRKKIKVSMRSSPHRVTVHRTVTFEWVRIHHPFPYSLPATPKSPPTGRGPPRGTPRVPAPLPLSPFSPPDRDRRGDSPAWSGRGSRPSRRTSG